MACLLALRIVSDLPKANKRASPQSIFLSVWLFHVYISSYSVSPSVVLFFCVSIPKYHLTCWKKDVRPSASQSLTSPLLLPSLKKLFFLLIFHFDKIPPDSTQTQPYSLPRVLWKATTLPAPMTHQWPWVVSADCCDCSTKAPREGTQQMQTLLLAEESTRFSLQYSPVTGNRHQEAEILCYTDKGGKSHTLL